MTKTSIRPPFEHTAPLPYKYSLLTIHGLVHQVGKAGNMCEELTVLIYILCLFQLIVEWHDYRFECKRSDFLHRMETQGQLQPLQLRGNILRLKSGLLPLPGYYQCFAHILQWPNDTYLFLYNSLWFVLICSIDPRTARLDSAIFPISIKTLLKKCQV